MQQWFILGTRTPTYESEPAREYPTAKVGRPASYVVTGNLMNRESAHISPSERVKGDFEQMVINGLKENSQTQKVKNNTEAEDERLCSYIIKYVHRK